MKIYPLKVHETKALPGFICRADELDHRSITRPLLASAVAHANHDQGFAFFPDELASYRPAPAASFIRSLPLN